MVAPLAVVKSPPLLVPPDVQQPALNVDRAGVVEHDIAIQRSDAGVAPDLRNVPKLSKRVRAAVVAAGEGVVTLRVPQTIVVNLGVVSVDAIEAVLVQLTVP